MPDLSAGAIKLLPVLGAIQEGAAAHDTTADLWARVSTAAAAQGFDISGANAIDLGQLRSWAATNAYAAEALNSAGATQTIDASMIGSELYTSAGTIEGQQALYNVRFLQTVVENGVELDLWRTSQIRGLLPPTKDQLQQLMDSDAQQLADEYNQTHVGIGSITVSVG